MADIDASSIHLETPEPERIVYASLAGALVGQVVYLRPIVNRPGRVRTTARRRVAQPAAGCHPAAPRAASDSTFMSHTHRIAITRDFCETVLQ
jgi:hypothetical protein